MNKMNLSVDNCKELIEILHYKDRIILYGAGLVGGLMYEWLKINELSDKVTCYVNSKVETPYEYKGLKVNALCSVNINDDTDIILVCSLSDKLSEMAANLEMMGMYQYICVVPRLYDAVEREYVNYKKDQIKNNKSDYDVMVFSQDNNATSGAFISMACLCEELHNLSGYKFIIVLPRYGDGEGVLENKGIDYTYFYRETTWIKRNNGIDEPEIQLVDEDEIKDLRDLIGKSGARLVHMSGVFVFAGSIAAKRLQIPVVWHLRENIVTQGNRFINHKAAYQILNSSNRIICVSKHVQDSFSGIDNSRVNVIYNGADDAVFYKRRRILDNNHVSIVMVGYITKLKGQETLVRSIDVLKKSMPKEEVPHVTFVGGADSEYLYYLKEFIRTHDLDDYITFAGRTSTPFDYYHNADIAISSTVGGEGFDRVRIEAMLSGCLLLSNDAGAAREIIKEAETGYLYKSGDERSLAHLIESVLQNRDNSRLIAENGQKICKNKFTKHVNAEQVLRVYKEFIV